MLKAFAIKGVALLTGLAATWALPEGWVALAIVAIVVATIGFIAWAILDPRNRFTAPVRLATDEPVVALDSRQTTAGAIVSRVAPRLVPGAIVALHDGTGFWGGTVRAPTLAALDCLLSECRTRGLRCVAPGDAAAVRG